MENNNPQGQQQNQQDADAKNKQSQEAEKQPHNDLTKEDIPDSTNENTGAMGSGQRQDSN